MCSLALALTLIRSADTRPTVPVLTFRIARGIEYTLSSTPTRSSIQMVTTIMSNSRWPDTGAEVVVTIDRSDSFSV
jgi:hypothetical protein